MPRISKAKAARIANLALYTRISSLKTSKPTSGTPLPEPEQVTPGLDVSVDSSDLDDNSDGVEFADSDGEDNDRDNNSNEQMLYTFVRTLQEAQRRAVASRREAMTGRKRHYTGNSERTQSRYRSA